MGKLRDIDSGELVLDEHKGGYGLALEKLAARLGCKDDEPLWQQLCDDVNITAPEKNGWVNVGDGEGTDIIYFNREPYATVEWSSRGFWFAEAVLRDGTRLFNKGANTELECEEWRETPYSMTEGA